MALPTFADFSERARAQGYDEVLERVWPPGHEVQEHSHPFDADLLVVHGEFWLGMDGQERHLRPGESCEVPRGLRHTERYGPEGATFWVARRH